METKELQGKGTAETGARGQNPLTLVIFPLSLMEEIDRLQITFLFGKKENSNQGGRKQDNLVSMVIIVGVIVRWWISPRGGYPEFFGFRNDSTSFRSPRGQGGPFFLLVMLVRPVRLVRLLFQWFCLILSDSA